MDGDTGRGGTRRVLSIAVKVTETSLAGGFVLPGSKVDVIWTPRPKEGNGVSQIIFTDVLVTAVDRSAKNTVSLKLKPEDAMKLKLAVENGELSLALRKPGGEDRAEPKKVDTIPELPPLPPKEKEGAALVVPPGMRAVALRISGNEVTTGFILPGSRIDLLVVEPPGPDKTVAKRVIENVLVLAVDTQAVRGEKPDLLRNTITVAVSVDDAKKLALASAMGEFSWRCCGRSSR